LSETRLVHTGLRNGLARLIFVDNAFDRHMTAELDL
jgi:hypothetical protein